MRHAEEPAECAGLHPKQMEHNLCMQAIMHVFARRITQQAELSGSGTCRDKGAKAASECGVLEKGEGNELDLLGEEVTILSASSRARFGTTCNAVQVAVYAEHKLGLRC